MIDYTWINKLRQMEVEMLLSRHPDLFRGKDLLEIGSGSGIQLAMLSRVCRRAIGVDCEQGEYSRYRVADVMNYDGVNLPFESGTYDVVYSSNVLEHVKDLPKLLDECRRVLRPGGCAVHVVPTHLWRCWSIITHYALVPVMVYERVRKRAGRRVTSVVAGPEKTHRLRLPRRAALSPLVFPARHGERGNRFTEAWYFRPKWWRAEFERRDWRVAFEEAAGLFYTTNALLGSRLGWRTRSALARVAGSACRLFVVVPHR